MKMNIFISGHAEEGFYFDFFTTKKHKIKKSVYGKSLQCYTNYSYSYIGDNGYLTIKSFKKNKKFNAYIGEYSLNKRKMYTALFNFIFETI